jgi:low temperature requirement protein LtrA
MTTSRHRLFRDRSAHSHSIVTYIELFFDLVFVFAITQLSTRLLNNLTLVGALETLTLFLAVWWVWIYTSWVTNWLDPERANVRLMLIAMMLGGLALSSGIPDAFGQTGLLFAGAYVAMQLFRSVYVVWASRGVDDVRTRNSLRVVFWFLLSAPLWLAGAVSPPDRRIMCWGAAIAIEYAGPFTLFWTPVLGPSKSGDWDISGAHMADRCALFIIIALGETVLVTGATFAGLPPDTPTTIAFVTSFLGSATMWWIYFDIGAKRASGIISSAENAGFIARNAYTYLHMPIVAGVIVSAVADEMVLAHPTGASSLTLILVSIGGPWLFLVGNQAFKWTTSEMKYPPLSHWIGMLLLLAIGGAAWWFGWQPLTIGIAATGALAFTAIWEWDSLTGHKLLR